MIRFACACGQEISVADSQAGLRKKCPKCGVVAAVPAPAAPTEEDAAWSWFGPMGGLPSVGGVAEVVLAFVAIGAGLMAITAGMPRENPPDPATVHTAWICFTVALAGIVAGRRGAATK